MSVKFNYKEVARKIATSDIGRKRINTVVQRKFDAAKAEMMEEFDSDVITQEIEQGSEDPEGAKNISGTLPEGYGNLYSFIGFSENPIPEARKALEESVTLVSTTKVEESVDSIKCKFSVRVNKENLRDSTPLPFETSQSWLDAIENGISGFSRYLAGIFRTPPSRSGGGVQADHDIRDGDYQPTPYVSKIIQNFVKALRERL